MARPVGNASGPHGDGRTDSTVNLAAYSQVTLAMFIVISFTATHKTALSVMSLRKTYRVIYIAQALKAVDFMGHHVSE